MSFLEKIFVMGLVMSSFLFSFLHAQDKKWTVYYGDKLPPMKVLSDYDLLVLEPQVPHAIDFLLENGKEVLGYLNLGEAETFRPYYKDLEKEDALLAVNPYWPDSRYIDLRNRYWTKLVIENLIPQILFQHYTGIFIDTIDHPIEYALKHPEKMKGMKQAAINLIKTIRYHYPNIKIMLNRGYHILPEVADQIDMLLAENLLTDDDGKKLYMRDLSEYNEDKKILMDAKKINPKLEIFTLDYWDPQDSKGLKKIYSFQRENGFIPYVATLELDQIIPEPQ